MQHLGIFLCFERKLDLISSWTFCFYRTQVSLGSGLWVPVSLSPSLQDLCENLTDVTLADDDTNSILTDNVNRAIEGNEAMQVLLVANFGSNASGVSWWPNFEPMQVVPLGDPICNWCKWCLLVAKFAISASSSIWWPKCANNGWGIIWWQNVLLANGRWRHLVAKIATNSSGPMNFFIGPRWPGPIFVSGCLSVTERAFVDLTDVTLADEDTKSILTDNANRAM